MLLCFPTPYPDEWWYSVLCRYFLRGGYTNAADARLELYGSDISHEGLMPNGTFMKVLRQLPPSVGFSARDILSKHTLAPFYLRFASPARREEAYGQILGAGNARICNPHNRTPDGGEGLRYCPVCYQEDAETYGEPYWHREHQIPLMLLCPKHSVPLRQYPVRRALALRGFYPLAQVKCSPEPETTDCSWATALSSVLYDFLALPASFGPTPGYNNLYQMLLGIEGMPRRYEDQDIVDAGILREYCSMLFGPNITAQYLRACSDSIVGCIKMWDSAIPERYALLCVLCELTATELFGPPLDEISASWERTAPHMRLGISRNAMARRLGISVDEMNARLRQSRRRNPYYKADPPLKTYMLPVRLTYQENYLLRQAVRSCGVSPDVFIRQVLGDYLGAYDIQDEQPAVG